MAKFRLGKIKNKYLIIDIFSNAYLTREEIMYRLYQTDKTTRTLVLQ